jgi:hypothetical protein
MTEQTKLIDVQPAEVEKIEFEPIKGYPMLYLASRQTYRTAID